MPSYLHLCDKCSPMNWLLLRKGSSFPFPLFISATTTPATQSNITSATPSTKIHFQHTYADWLQGFASVFLPPMYPTIELLLHLQPHRCFLNLGCILIPKAYASFLRFNCSLNVLLRLLGFQKKTNGHLFLTLQPSPSASQSCLCFTLCIRQITVLCICIDHVYFSSVSHRQIRSACSGNAAFIQGASEQTCFSSLISFLSSIIRHRLRPRESGTHAEGMSNHIAVL